MTAETFPELHATSPFLTVPADVHAHTPLASLNLNWTRTDLPERVRTKHVHGLYPPDGTYIPQLAEVVLRKFFAPGQTILDPFCDSGVTLVQANELGIRAAGWDADPFAMLLCAAKTGHYAAAQVEREAADLLGRVQGLAETDAPNQLRLLASETFDAGAGETDEAYLQMWFAPQARRELLAYRQGIADRELAYGALWRVVLARAARAARLVSHDEADAPVTPQNGPYWCHKHGRMCEPPSRALAFLRRDSADALARVAEFQALRTNAAVTLVEGRADAVKFPRADGILTAPPAFGLPAARTRLPEAYALLDLHDGDGAAAEEATGGRGRAAQAAYVERVGRVLAGAVRAVPRGAPVVLAVVDRQRLYADIARQAGLDVEAVLVREGAPRGQAVWICRKG